MAYDFVAWVSEYRRLIPVLRFVIAINADMPSFPSMMYSSISPELSYTSSEFIPPPPSPIASHSPDFFVPEPSYSPDERLPPLGGRRAPTPPPPEEDDYTPPSSLLKYGTGRGRNPAEPPMPTAYIRRTPPPSGRHRSQFKTRQPRNSMGK